MDRLSASSYTGIAGPVFFARPVHVDMPLALLRLLTFNVQRKQITQRL